MDKISKIVKKITIVIFDGIFIELFLQIEG